MSIYLISNRRVINGKFSNKGTERAKRDFRVATWLLAEFAFQEKVHDSLKQ